MSGGIGQAHRAAAGSFPNRHVDVAYPELNALYAPVLLMAPAQGQSPWAGMIPILMLVLIFYFLLIAPVRKRQKQHEHLVANLKHGDKVVTSGGIFGTVVGIEDERLRLKVADQVKIEITKASVAGRVDETD